MKIISAKSIGQKAKEILIEGVNLSVIGVTSRGIFLEGDTGWMLFMSGEKYRGPLTLNFPNLVQIKDRIKIGMVGKNSGNGIFFNDINLEVVIQEAEVWAYHPATLGDIQLQAERAIEGLKRIEHDVIASLVDRNSASFTNNEVLLELITGIPDVIRMEDYQSALEKISRILGMGEGLTPEGDDFVIGFLFTLRIANLLLNEKYERFEKEIVELAQEKTTRLSANLIECAAYGQVDERISQVVDSLITAQELCDSMNDLMTWGNTSGGMVLAGIIAGVMAIREYD